MNIYTSLSVKQILMRPSLSSEFNLKGIFVMSKKISYEMLKNSGKVVRNLTGDDIAVIDSYVDVIENSSNFDEITGYLTAFCGFEMIYNFIGINGGIRRFIKVAGIIPPDNFDVGFIPTAEDKDRVFSIVSRKTAIKSAVENRLFRDDVLVPMEPIFLANGVVGYMFLTPITNI